VGVCCVAAASESVTTLRVSYSTAADCCLVCVCFRAKLRIIKQAYHVVVTSVEDLTPLAFHYQLTHHLNDITCIHS